MNEQRVIEKMRKQKQTEKQPSDRTERMKENSDLSEANISSMRLH